MSFFAKIAHNTLSQVAARVISSGIGFLITILIARYFGIGAYGDIAKIIGFGSLFYVCIDLGMNAIFLRLEEREQKFGNLLSLRLIISLFLFLLAALIVFVLPYRMATGVGYSILVKFGILFFSLSFFSRAVVFSTAALFQKKLVYFQTVKASLASSLTTLCVVGIAIGLRLPYIWVIAGYITGGFMEAGISLFLTKDESRVSLNRHVAKKLLFQSLPLTLLLVLNLIYFRVDVVLLSLFKKSADVGIYDFAYRFFDFFIALPLFLSNSLYPDLLNREKNNRNLMKNTLFYTLVFFALGICVIPFVWFGSPLLAFVKKDFLPSVSVLRILILFLPVFFATSILQWICIAKKKQNFLVFIYGFSLVLNVILNLIFIPQYSYTASAIITGISETIVLIFLFIYMFFI